MKQSSASTLLRRFAAGNGRRSSPRLAASLEASSQRLQELAGKSCSALGGCCIYRGLPCGNTSLQGLKDLLYASECMLYTLPLHLESRTLNALAAETSKPRARETES